MLEDVVDEITVADKLKEAILMEETENYPIFDTIRNDFLFLLFSHITLGGSLCQYEDTVDAYLETTKLFFKDLVSAARDPDNGTVYIRSLCFKIETIENTEPFPTKPGHYQNFFYLLVDPYTRQLNVFTHEFVPYW